MKSTNLARWAGATIRLGVIKEAAREHAKMLSKERDAQAVQIAHLRAEVADRAASGRTHSHVSAAAFDRAATATCDDQT